jgi:hypothetical protein
VFIACSINLDFRTCAIRSYAARRLAELGTVAGFDPAAGDYRIIFAEADGEPAISGDQS